MPLTTTRPEITGSLGAVASTHWLASQAGMGVLERGGNAFDAAAAAGFVLQVVEPHLNGPGGDLPVVLWSAAGGADGGAHVVCGQGTVPAAATPQAFADRGLTAVPGSGLLAATVPGAFGAWTLLLQRWGTWRLRDVLEPALGYARHGAPVLPRVAATLESVAPLYTRGEGAWTTSAQTYLDADGSAPQAWSRLRLTALADTYERVLAAAEAAGSSREAQYEAAREHWYRGEVADVVDRFCSTTRWRDVTGAVDGGLLRGSDLAGWEPTVEAPALGGYRDVQVAKTGTWGQGPVLLQSLALLDGVLDDGPGGGVDPLPDDDDAWVHACAEAFDLASADREAWYGDPEGAAEDGVDVPAVADLLDPAYTASRRAFIGERAGGELQPGWPGGASRRLPRLPVPPQVDGVDDEDGDVAFGEPTVDRRPPADERGPGGRGREELGRGDTCHVDVADRWGNLVSATPSGGWLQSSPVIPELGFPLGTRAQMCWLPGAAPRTLGSVLRPGRRPRTTLSPTILLRDGEPWMAVGTPGGDQQDAWQLPFVLRLVHGAERARRRSGGAVVETALQAAVDAPTFHTETAPSSFWPRQAAPGRLLVEDRFGPGVAPALAARGWDVQVVDGWSLGRLSAVALDGGWVRAAANARGAQGYAVGR